MSEILKYSQLEKHLFTLRKQKVILDNDVADLCGRAIIQIEETVKNNPDKFPERYIFELNVEEKKELVKILNNPPINLSSASPNIFTEKGLYLLAAILAKPQATQITIDMVETFAQIKENYGGKFLKQLADK
ncbi:MAG: ORF6N domain-containing protein [Bacteroidales bacterium]|jgi:hypothetical protein|nr:ORF6N domain-containing protein [Bacteroidales bacterium]